MLFTKVIAATKSLNSQSRISLPPSSFHSGRSFSNASISLLDKAAMLILVPAMLARERHLRNSRPAQFGGGHARRPPRHGRNPLPQFIPRHNWDAQYNLHKTLAVMQVCAVSCPARERLA